MGREVEGAEIMPLNELTGIPEEKRIKALSKLEDLLTYRNTVGKLSPVITGFNWYATSPAQSSSVVLSHIHSTEAYKEAMINDLEKLGYDRKDVLSNIREKSAVFVWDLDYNLRDEKRQLLPNLRIKDIRNGNYLNLSGFSKPLSEYPKLKNLENYLIGEDSGWQLDMPISDERKLGTTLNLFLRKSGKYIYDDNGFELPETESERKKRKPWKDAYETPVLIVGQNALKYAAKLNQFDTVTKISLWENNNEISFIIQKNLNLLKSLNHYESLVKLGFKEETCLANKPFLREVNNER